jgi:hypothetical protein
MNLHEAALELQKGHRVRRKCWTDSWLERNRDWELFVNDGRGKLGPVGFAQFGGKVCPNWLPDLTDLCADDWEVVP